MSLNLSFQERSIGHFVIMLSGKLDTETYGQLESLINSLATDKVLSITLNMTGLTYISSMGLRVIIQAAKLLKERQAQLVISDPPASIRAVLEMARTLPGQAIFSSVAEADSYFDNVQKNTKNR